VETRALQGIAIRKLWMACGPLKNLEIAGKKALCSLGNRRRKAFTTESGDWQGGNPGKRQEGWETGSLVQPPGFGEGLSGAKDAERSAGRYREDRRGPSIPYVEGPRHILPDLGRIKPERHARRPSPGRQPSALPAGDHLPSRPATIFPPGRRPSSLPAGDHLPSPAERARASPAAPRRRPRAAFFDQHLRHRRRAGVPGVRTRVGIVRPSGERQTSGSAAWVTGS
jgi:hypothetical protein